MRTKRAAILWCLLSVTHIATAQAAVVEALDLQKMVQLSDRIVVGKVASSQSHFLPGERLIVTDSVVQVETTLKGEHQQDVVVRTSGGVVGEIGQRVSGSAQLTSGERVLLILESRGKTAQQQPLCKVVGLSLGKYRLLKDATGRSVATRDISQLVTLDPKTRKAVHPDTGALSTQKLVQEIKLHVARPIPRP